MTTGNITISKQHLLNAYREAEPSQKEFMKQLFGAETFASNVMERVKTFQDAVNELGDVHPLVRQFVCVCNIAFNNSGVKLDADIIAYLKLRIITAALNEGWEPKFNKDGWRYYPYFYLITKEEYEQLSDEEKQCCVGRSSVNAVAYGGLVFADSYFRFCELAHGQRGAPCLQNTRVSGVCGKAVLEHLGRFCLQNRRPRKDRRKVVEQRTFGFLQPCEGDACSAERIFPHTGALRSFPFKGFGAAC